MKKMHALLDKIGYHVKFPVGIYYLLLWLVVLLFLFFFRTPPLSLSASNTYFQTDGSKTEAILKTMPAHIEKTVVSDKHTIHVDANVHVPQRKIAIYKACNAQIDMNHALKTFYPDDTEFDYVQNVEMHPALFYDMAYAEVTGENSFFELIENGRIDFYFFDENPIGSPQEAIYFVQRAGIATNELQLLDYSKDGYYVFRPIIDGIPVSNHDTFDSYRGTVNPDGCLELIVENGYPKRLKGNYFQAAEVLWESAGIVSVDVALQSLCSVLEEDIIIEEITLVYQPRSLLGNPFDVHLIPMWEFKLKYDYEAISLVNAINGIVELYNSRR